MDRFLGKYKLPQLIRCELDNLNSPTLIKKIEFLILKLLKKTFSGPDDFTGELHQIFKEFV